MGLLAWSQRAPGRSVRVASGEGVGCPCARDPRGLLKTLGTRSSCKASGARLRTTLANLRAARASPVKALRSCRQLRRYRSHAARHAWAGCKIKRRASHWSHLYHERWSVRTGGVYCDETTPP